MKKLIFFLILTIISYYYSSAQSSDELEIKKAETTWSEALVKYDTLTLQKLWSADYVINNPMGKVVTGKEILNAMKAGVRYQAYEKTIDRITFIDNIAVVMGKESLLDKPMQPTQSTVRRFTDIWMKKGGEWKLIARQATNIN